MSIIIARTYSGGKDLNVGLDLTGATILEQLDKSTKDNYVTELKIKDTRGFEHTIIIQQEKEC